MLHYGFGHFLFGGFMKMAVTLILIAIPLALLALYVTAIMWVYKDAHKRNLNPLVWILIVILVPSFIGFLIYFLARPNNITSCGNCGSSIDSKSNVCPYCGQVLRKTCPHCKREVSSNWRNCPDCGTVLHRENNNMQ